VLAHWLLVPPERRVADGAAGLEGGFDAMYVRGDPPWEIGRPQVAFQRLADAGELTGRVLDVGCGTGEHVLLAAALGLEVVGVDLAPTAIARAEAKAADRALQARFEVMDVVDLPALGTTFDTVLDCGMFHTLSDEVIPRFVAALAAVLRPGGRYHLLCMSDRQVGRAGPRRISEAAIRSTFADGWRIVRLDPAPLEVTFGPGALEGWSATIVRR
jgi:SAM-dependent methyltransferase